MSKLKTTIAFLAGAAIGGTAVWYITKEKFAQIAQEEIDSVKATYAKREQERRQAEESVLKEETDISEEEPAPQTKILSVNKVQEKGSIGDFAAKRVKDGYVDYSTTVVPPKEEPAEEVQTSAERGVDIPYVILPEEFDELEGYTLVSLTYFADGILSDENGIIVEDIEEMIGDAVEHFGEYEEDSVYVRNDAKRCDYEILRDERDYADFRKTLPPNI